MSLILDNNGIIKKLNIKTPYESLFFRKVLNLHDEIKAIRVGAKNELKIAKILLKNPQKNIVKVFKVSKNFIDYEKLKIIMVADKYGNLVLKKMRIKL